WAVTGREKPWHKQPGPMAGRPLEWLTAVSDYPGDLPPAWAEVLLGLLGELDWKTGRGYAPVPQIAVRARRSDSTVKRATGWATGCGVLAQPVRGGHRWDGFVTASGWELRPPSQWVTGDLLCEDGETTTQQVSPDPTQQVNPGPHNRSVVTPPIDPNRSTPST